MSVAAPEQLMTSEQLDAMPDDGIERWLIRGKLREKRDDSEKEMTRRNRGHSRIEGRIAQFLNNWADKHARPRGEVLVGEAGVYLRRHPDTSVGADVAYISPETAEANPDEETFIEGVPVLIAEILSPSDKHEEIAEKVEEYLECGVKLVWVVDPAFKTITLYRPDAEPQLFNITHSISGEPHLPGFEVPVRDLFA